MEPVKGAERILTPRLELMRIRADDLPHLLRMHADPEVMITLGGVRSPEETTGYLGVQLDHWDRHGFGPWIARDRATGAFAGRGGLRNFELDGAPEVEVGYALMSEFWGRGLATEMAEATVRFGFANLALPELVCFALPTNAGSRRVMEKVGFCYERDFEYKGRPHVLYRQRNPLLTER